MKKGLLEQIKSRGYWRVNFQPLVLAHKIPSLGECSTIVRDSRVELRGWDYPHYPLRQDADSGIETGNDYYQGWVDWEGIKEFWRMYRSGQFIHIFGMREDWVAEDSWHSAANKVWEPGAALSVISTVYTVTEIFEFASRLTKRGIYGEGIRIALSLHNTPGRALRLDDPNRIPLSMNYKTGANDISFDWQYSSNQVLSKSKDLAFDAIVQIFDRFQWHSPNKDSIRRDQERLLSKNL